MNYDEIEKLIRKTADYVLRECYIFFGDMNRAEKAFMDVYLCIYRSGLPYRKAIKKKSISSFIVAVCNQTITTNN